MDIVSVGAAVARAKGIPGSAAQRAEAAQTAAEAAQAAAEAAAAEAEAHDKTVQVIGTTPTITANASTRYVCTASTVSELTITPPASGICSVLFTSGSTPTVLAIPSGVTVHWPRWFDPLHLQANTTYELSFADRYGAVGLWT